MAVPTVPKRKIPVFQKGWRQYGNDCGQQNQRIQKNQSCDTAQPCRKTLRFQADRFQMGNQCVLSRCILIAENCKSAVLLHR